MNDMLRLVDSNANLQNALKKYDKELKSMAASLIQARRRGRKARKALEPFGNFTYVNKAAASNYFKGFKGPRRIKLEEDLPRDLYYDNKGKLHFMFEAGEPHMIKPNIGTMVLPPKGRRITITDGETSSKKKIKRMYNIDTLEKWLLQTKQPVTPLKNPIISSDYAKILAMAQNKNSIVRILYGPGYTWQRFAPNGRVLALAPSNHPQFTFNAPNSPVAISQPSRSRPSPWGTRRTSLRSPSRSPPSHSNIQAAISNSLVE